MRTKQVLKQAASIIGISTYVLANRLLSILLNKIDDSDMVLRFLYGEDGALEEGILL